MKATLSEQNGYSVIRHKLSTFRQDPLGSARRNIKRNISWLLSQWATQRLRQRAVLDSLSEFLSHRPLNAIPPNFADLWFLYYTVRVRKPQAVLEFGSGCSTVILAQALCDNQRDGSKPGLLYSVDADPHWADVTGSSLPAHLRDFCEVSYSPLVKLEYEGTPAFQHANVPAVRPNFLYLDGPSLTPDRQVAVDVLNIEDNFPPDFYMVIDGRTTNTFFLKKYLKRKYCFKERKLFFNCLFELIE